jgi:hypothetical protein
MMDCNQKVVVIATLCVLCVQALLPTQHFFQREGLRIKDKDMNVTGQDGSLKCFTIPAVLHELASWNAHPLSALLNMHFSEFMLWYFSAVL